MNFGTRNNLMAIKIAPYESMHIIGKYGVCHIVAISFTLKEELWKLKYFTIQKYNIFKK
jgi:hypothetical protein